ncbi:branched-chain amino acid ABC transporter permease [Clostridium tagluense]|uniref:branched-chain amino acid ABC transporter permease n=1 Tax=Clostridium tagluense TaxID=360422 RepID=UPI001C0CC804|nr:branched-chain amino acid ABC transporter permease [Clostridium tagluense]MBU3128858.1 branched-chain amino acid ABC transporter permease [Clostridium tagluense]MCB2310369.1 branched-chain amino acid ABC transporter permease [Clostridium tagluense]MCB2314989.1 branched-chain amino acid ABC transporter permease [Clostridium tagluense]MCB2320070.1 branched-chain amino acid ABC transporter permease [Clostridium tagluense]MCB2324732.1 branched-chain amino acid ABC transporter permease [Clostrid
MKIFNRNNILGAFIVILIYILGQVLINAGILDSYIFLNIVVIGINIILAVSLNLITGFTGQFSLGHAAFMAIGAYVSAVATMNFGLPFAVALILGAVSAALAGIVIGIPTLRLKGDYLAIATLGFGEIVRIIILNNEYIGGASGLNDIPQSTNWTWLYFMTAATVILIKNFISSKGGRACIAIGQDEIASESMGINTTFYKVLAFAIGAFFAGIGGALYSGYFFFIKPEAFGFMKSIDILVILVFGGMGSIEGSIAGAIVLSLISLALQDIPELRMVIYSVILFLIMVYRPQGLMGNYKIKLFKKGGLENVSFKSK